ncbi:MAG: hypothetical protein KF817_04910 [Phycisphaeraceae bacterium]|nr:hypothetical protein [Phycisphaeraceae bacterium]
MALSCLFPGLRDMSRSAHADPPRYQMTEISIIGFQPDADLEGRFGINNCGQIAFTRRLSGGSYRAMVWLPEAAFGKAAGVHDLSTWFVDTSGQDPEPILTGHSYARDIGDGGFIVGQFGGTGIIAGTGKAFIADPADILGLPWQVLVFQGEAPSPCDPENRWARAMAVTGDDDPAVVLETGRDGTCVYSDCQGSEDSRCFVSAGVLEDLGGTPAFSPLDRAVCVTGGPAMPSTLAYDAERRTVVIEEEEVEEIDCRREAVLWPASSSALVRLHDAVDAVAFHSRAESINRASFLTQVVGWDTDQVVPLLWRLPAYASMTNSGAWEGWRLQIGGGAGTVEIECEDCETVLLRQAFDVNDHGWIIAWGERGSQGDDRYRLYLLTPIDGCDRPGDLDEDGGIGFSDLLLLLANWGPCGHACAWCPWDLDGNRDVGFSDLLILSSNWGVCGQQAMGLPQSVQDCIARVGYDPVALAACIATIE